MPLDLLLVTLDTVRADHLGAYGGTATTPAIDALAAKGVVFDDASTTAPLTLPAHTSILTGRELADTGVRSNHDQVPATLPTGVERLAAAGYHTAAFTSGRPVARDTGLTRTFEQVDDARPDALAGQRAPAERRGSATVAAAVAWWKATEGPRFAWVHLYDAHTPWTPTQGKGYDAELADVDRALGELLTAVGPQVAVVVVGDHGEGLGTRGEAEHGVFLYQPTVRVPLVVSVPGQPARPVATPVSVIDVMPTLLRAAGLPEDLPGLDLLGPIPGDRRLVAETDFPFERYGWAPLRMVRQSTVKAIDAPEPELYDLRLDPWETRPQPGAEVLLDDLPPRVVRSARQEDAERARELAALGYVSGPVSTVAEPPDPKARAKLLPKLDQAQDAVFAGDHARAVRLLEVIVAEDPTNPAAHNDLGLSLQAMGDYERALVALARAAELAPDDAAIWSNVGVSAGRLGRLDDARRAYERAAKLAPTNAAPCVNRAALELRAGEREEARRWAEEALRREPGMQPALDVLGQLPPR
ncbi:MAG: sulfatase-like hydrolase/transferase [Myxococcales bacterium]|nr:sulfatase-like hydrolase/transferase [Myxococcales bacterium]